MVNNRLDNLGLLRGIAVILVCLCHFCAALDGIHFFSETFQIFHEYGKYGVQIFFVISGFVIPLSLRNGNYAINDYFLFLYKRILRLHPPYVAALALTLVIMFLSYNFQGKIFPENTFSIIQSFFYLHIPADNPVFWTLIVEAQYYVFIGLFYIVINRFSKVTFVIIIPLLMLIGLIDNLEELSLLPHLIYFIIGTWGYIVFVDKYDNKINLLALLALVSLAFIFYNFYESLFAALTITFILLFKKSVPVFLQFPGKISYSIYLIHFPIGVKFLNLMKTRIDPSYSWALMIVVLLLIFILSWIFSKIFEDPSEKLSKAIKYRGGISYKTTEILGEKKVV